MIENILILIFSLFLVVKGATLATKYSVKIAEIFHMPKYTVSFVIIAFISILPETLISINSAFQGIPEFGLGTLFGSNIADLTLIFAILIIYAGRNIKIKSKILNNVSLYPYLLLIPIIFGFNGHYSRTEGVALIIAGSLFYYMVFKNNKTETAKLYNKSEKYKNTFLLLTSVIFLLIGAHFTVISATKIAYALGITPVLIGMLVVSLGTTLPELFYSLKSVKSKDDELAVGDILGSVLADATIVIGIIAFISPFYFPTKIIYITGGFMMLASFILVNFMSSGKLISKKEGYLLLLFWMFYIIVELLVNI